MVGDATTRYASTRKDRHESNAESTQTVSRQLTCPRPNSGFAVCHLQGNNSNVIRGSSTGPECYSRRS